MLSKMKIVIIALCIFVGFEASGHINPNARKSTTSNTFINFREDCTAATTLTIQNINNVRATLFVGGDVWWDLQNGGYIVPVPEVISDGVSSIFAGGVWIGGRDPAGNLKIAAGPNGAYSGINGTDWYPGPLTPDLGSTSKDTCENWDRFFEVQGENILKTVALWNNDGPVLEEDVIPEDVKFWPGKGNPFWLDKFDFPLPTSGQGLGNFWDEDQDGDYDPRRGDFPLIDIRGCEPNDREEAVQLLPDEMIFWIYNDNGGPHPVSQGNNIRMEVQVQAFAYATNDAINDMTFQRYKLINRATTDILDCYFAMWVDPDLGCHEDDYIGCDLDRSLMYIYNEDVLDGQPGCSCANGVNTYCDEVPILGVDYFRGPLAPRVWCPDDPTMLCEPEPGTGNVDTLVEIGMSRFMYYNNNIGPQPPATTDPDTDDEFYGYLRGFWKDGSPLTFGGSGYDINSTETVRYAFTDRPDNSTGWSMCTSSVTSGDRRTLQTTGPLLLQPGAVNELIIGAVWVPDIDYPCPDITRLLNADDLAQNLFDNCFDIKDGPDAPDVALVELDREVIIVLSNDTLSSNNKFESYEEIDINAPVGVEDSIYRFEGYQIYQLASPTVTVQELNDASKAKVIYQSDLDNDVVKLYNWTSTNNPLPGGPRVWADELKVDAANAGIRKSFRVTQDAFATDDKRLINHKKYYFMALAYAFNTYDENNFNLNDETGQPRPFCQGRRNIATYTAIPRPILYQDQKVQFGDGPVVTRLSGEGVGSNVVEMSDDMYNRILDGTTDGKISYKPGLGPVTVEVYNPLDIVSEKFRLSIDGNFLGGAFCGLDEGATWKLENLSSGEVINSDATIDQLNEQLINKYGFSVSIAQSGNPGSLSNENNGALDILVDYENETGSSWYFGIPDGGGNLGEQLGSLGGALNFLKTADGEADEARDPNQAFSSMGNGSWYPFILADYRVPGPAEIPFYITPAWKDNKGHSFLQSRTGLDDLNNVDIIFTSDKSKWSRCAVVETATQDHILAGFATVGNTGQFDLRQSPSVDKNGQPDGDGMGMGWFPGYAVNVETGKRLNIFFGENSTYNENYLEYLDNGEAIGADMIFNPSSQIVADVVNGQGGLGVWNIVAGGGHMIYVTRQEYDECAQIRSSLAPGQLFTEKFDALELVTWSSMAMTRGATLSLDNGLIPNDLTVKLRVEKPYSREKIVEFGISSCKTIDALPVYELDFTGFQPTDPLPEEFDNILSEVNVVPNPYYAYSAYETSQFDNFVKITNLPDRSTVTIYSLDGKFIREYKRDEIELPSAGSNPGTRSHQTAPDVTWDMRNFAGIPIASGVYLIHISAPDFGVERTIKWFGINRKFDPTGL